MRTDENGLDVLVRMLISFKLLTLVIMMMFWRCFFCVLVRMVVVLFYLVGNGSALDMFARFQCLNENSGYFNMLDWERLKHFSDNGVVLICLIGK